MKKLLLMTLLLAATSMAYAADRVCPDPALITVTDLEHATVAASGWDVRVDYFVAEESADSEMKFMQVAVAHFVKGEKAVCFYSNSDISGGFDGTVAVMLISKSLINNADFSGEEWIGNLWEMSAKDHFCNASRTECAW